MPLKIPSPLGLARKVLPVVCPNPSVSVSLPPKITFSCRK